MSEQVKRVCANTLTGLIDIAHEQRHALINQGFSDDDEGDALSRVRDSRVARIDRIIEAARADQPDDYDALHAEAEALRAENVRLREERDSFQREGIRAMEELKAARGLLRDAAAWMRGVSGHYGAKNTFAEKIDTFLTATHRGQASGCP